jgi:UDP-3-O-[3-hydroxymyristoyl] glucosamine N-acyltransferase
VTLTVQELAALVGGQFASEADGSKPITGGAAIAEAGEGDVTFFGNAKYLAALKKCRATAVLVPLDFSDVIPPIAIRVENPSLAFARLAERFAPPPVEFAPGIHPTAVIAKDATIADGVSIQPFAVVESGAIIGTKTVIGAHSYIGHAASVGEACVLHPRVTIGARCVIGRRVILHSGVVLGSDGFGFEFSAGRHLKVPQVELSRLTTTWKLARTLQSIGRGLVGRG